MDSSVLENFRRHSMKLLKRGEKLVIPPHAQLSCAMENTVSVVSDGLRVDCIGRELARSKKSSRRLIHAGLVSYTLIHLLTIHAGV